MSFSFFLSVSNNLGNFCLCEYSKNLRLARTNRWFVDFFIIWSRHHLPQNVIESTKWFILFMRREHLTNSNDSTIYSDREEKSTHTHTVCASMPCYMFGFVLFCIFFSNFLSKTTHNVLELFLICGVQWSSTAVHIQYVAFMFTKFLWKKYFGFYSVYYFSGPQVFFRPQVWVTHRHIDLTTFCFCIWKRSIELLLVKAMLLLLLMRCFRYYYCAWERAHARTHAQMVGFIWIQIKW